MGKELNLDNPEVKTPPPLIFLGFGLFGIVIHYLKPLTITGKQSNISSSFFVILVYC